jgi:hypothetical protein
MEGPTGEAIGNIAQFHEELERAPRAVLLTTSGRRLLPLESPGELKDHALATAVRIVERAGASGDRTSLEPYRQQLLAAIEDR